MTVKNTSTNLVATQRCRKDVPHSFAFAQEKEQQHAKIEALQFLRVLCTTDGSPGDAGDAMGGEY